MLYLNITNYPSNPDCNSLLEFLHSHKFVSIHEVKLIAFALCGMEVPLFSCMSIFSNNLLIKLLCFYILIITADHLPLFLIRRDKFIGLNSICSPESSHSQHHIQWQLHLSHITLTLTQWTIHTMSLMLE